MTNDHHDEHERSPVEDIYDELAGEFERVARADSRSRARSLLRRKLVLVPAAVLVLAGGTAGIAAAVSSTILSPDGHELVPARTEPLFGPACPAEVWDSLWELDDLSDYAGTPGYPVPGCPTLEDLEADGEFLALWQRVDQLGDDEKRQMQMRNPEF